MLTAGMSIRAFARELNVDFSTKSHRQHHLREFVSTSSRHNRRPCVWRRVGKQFADVNVVNRVPLRGGGGMVRHELWTTYTIAFN